MSEDQKPLIYITAPEVRKWLGSILGALVIAGGLALYNSVNGQRSNTQDIQSVMAWKDKNDRRDAKQDELLSIHARGLEMLICEHRRDNGQTCDFYLTPRKD